MIPPALLTSTAIILLSFVSEDAATLSSALTLFGGPITWPIGFLSCFLGIWFGDLALYCVARYAARPVILSRWLARFANPSAIDRCQQTFARHTSRTLFLSRFVPGTRLVTYIAAGLSPIPTGKFAFVTGIAAFLWIAVVFGLTKLLGTQLLIWFMFVQTKIAAGILVLLLLTGVILLVRKFCFCSSLWRHITITLRRWRRWEFWPAWLFYAPVAVWYAWLAIRFRGFTLPTAANPGIPTGGFVGESKIAILKQLQGTHPDFVAEAFSVPGETATDRLLSLHQIIRKRDVTLPFILKPDVGQRGHGVRLIRSIREALDYLQQVDSPVILQRYATGQHEAGIFYFRFPNQATGRIFSITEKIFPSIIGDGTRTIEELIRADHRAALIADIYLKRLADRKREILPTGQQLKLVESGNHAQGCIFREGGHLWSEALERKIDEISRAFPGFYIGRFDVRYEESADLRAGRNFQIVELNGASSEATNIYDTRTSLFEAYQVLFRQWNLVFKIGAANRARGHGPSSLTTLWRDWRRYSFAALSYPVAS